MTISASDFVSRRHVATLGTLLVVACSTGAPQGPSTTRAALRDSRAPAVAAEGPDLSQVPRGHTEVRVPDIVLPPPMASASTLC